jgi:hypothetical protein
MTTHHARTIKVESLVTTDKARPSIVSYATFRAVEERGQIGLVLDLEPQEPGIYMRLFHPVQSTLIKIAESTDEVVYRHTGQPIDVSQFVDLPAGRRGFVIHSDPRWPRRGA